MSSFANVAIFTLGAFVVLLTRQISAFQSQSHFPLHRAQQPSALQLELSLSPNQPPFKLENIDHVVIRCRNFEPMFDFYHRILGCTVDQPIDSHLNRFGGALTHLRAGSCYIDLLAYDASHVSEEGLNAVASMHAGGQGASSLDKVEFSSDTSTLDHLCIRIEPFDERIVMDYLEKENVPIVVAGGNRLGADGLGTSIYVSDPEGNIVELKGPPQRSNVQLDHTAVKREVKLTAPTDHKIDGKIKSVTPTVRENSEVDTQVINDNNQSSDQVIDIAVSSTPCVRICRYNSSFHDGQVCIGCYREAYEIQEWASMSAVEKSFTLIDAMDRCENSEGTFEGAISKDELVKQYQYWEEISKIN